jgi:hypothetical protein
MMTFGPDREESAMTTSMSSLAARERVAELRRVAEHRRAVAGTHEPSASEAAGSAAVSLRIAGVDDEQVVRDLAALDDATAPEGEVLLALIDGEAAAALSLRDGHVVANPFVRTEAAVALLRLRAEHVSSGRPRRRRPFSLRPRFA